MTTGARSSFPACKTHSAGLRARAMGRVESGPGRERDITLTTTLGGLQGITGNPGITETTETHATTTGSTGTRATTTVSTGTPVTTTTTSVSAGVSALGAGSASIGAERISTTRTGSEGRGAAAHDLQGSTGSQRRRTGTRKGKGGNKRLALKSLTIYFAYYSR